MYIKLAFEWIGKHTWASCSSGSMKVHALNLVASHNQFYSIELSQSHNRLQIISHESPALKCRYMNALRLYAATTHGISGDFTSNQNRQSTFIQSRLCFSHITATAWFMIVVVVIVADASIHLRCIFHFFAIKYRLYRHECRHRHAFICI